MKGGLHMNLFKEARLAIAAACALCAGSALADYSINWRIDDSSPYSFDYAMILSNDGSGNLAYLNMSDKGVNTGYNKYGSDAAEGPGTSLFAGDIKGVTSLGSLQAASEDYSFRVELYGYGDGNADSLLAQTDFASWGSLASGFNCLNANVQLKGGEGVWVLNGTDFHAVPEPTSGMLFLLGLASLALRRRRV